jgi:hypothetical protein
MNRASIEKAAIERATREATERQFKQDLLRRLDIVEHQCPYSCVDSIKDAIKEIDGRIHIKPQF